MGGNVAEILVALAPLVAALGLLAWKRVKRLGTLQIGLVATSLGLSLSIATYFWVFTGGNCADSLSFTCRMNGNQGILTLLTLVLAVIALWTSAIARYSDQRRDERAAHSKFAQHLNAALGEARHNLIHIAMAYGDGHALREMPQFQSERLKDLARPEFASFIDSDFSSELSAAIRTCELAKKEELLPHSEGATPEGLRMFTCAQMRLLNAAIVSANHPSWIHSDPAMRDIDSARDPHAKFPFYASTLVTTLPHLRTNQVPVFCWLKDQELEGVKVVGMKDRIRDYQLDRMARRRLT